MPWTDLFEHIELGIMAQAGWIGTFAVGFRWALGLGGLSTTR